MVYQKKFKEPVTSYNTIKERAAQRGFTVVGVDDADGNPYVHLKCSKGHKFGRHAYRILLADTKCQICDGKLHDLPKAVEVLGQQGISFVGKPTLTKDKYGNDVLKSATPFRAKCHNGHEFNLRLTEFYKDPQCKRCAKGENTVFTAGFSRSEEIIAGVLDHINVPYTRQEVLEDKYENLRLDFFLPDHKMIIEYDGAHHVYGRTDTTEEQLNDIQRRDRLRDQYALDKGLNMVRIPHTAIGKAIVHYLASILPVDIHDSYYDSLIQEVSDRAAKEFGWMTYEEMKHHADTYLHNSLSRSAVLCGVSQSVIARRFRYIYGVNKADY